MIDIKIIVCIKQVPGTTEIKINPETNTLVREGIETVINPFDTYAIEEGVRLKEKLAPMFSQTDEEIETIALTMGPPQSNEMLKEAIALGIDKAVLLSDRAFAGADTWATALTLAEAIKKFTEWKLIILGTLGIFISLPTEIAAGSFISKVSYLSSISLFMVILLLFISKILLA